MREMKCPVCAGEVPRTLLSSKGFACPTCKEPLRVRDPSPLWAIPLGAAGYSLTFVIAQRMGLKGGGLFTVTLLLGCAASFLLACAVGGLMGWVFQLPPPLERDPGDDFDGGRVLHIESPPRPRQGPQ